jgi:hypothetical protein
LGIAGIVPLIFAYRQFRILEAKFRILEAGSGAAGIRYT